jgi:UDP-N-acetylglucosamine acyltransferase
MARIHPTAVVEPGARIDPSALVGPYAVIGPHVVVGPACRVEAHSVLQGETVLGAGNRVGPHAVLGAPPQIRETTGDDAGGLEIGDGCWFREMTTVHLGGAPGRLTRVGSRCMLMAYSHIAHDCVVGDGVELANGVQLAGHVEVGDLASLGGLAAVHQFVRVGRLAFVGAGAMVSQDVPPFALVSGDRARVYDTNRVGLERRDVAPHVRRRLRTALRMLLGAPTVAEGVAAVREAVEPCAEVDELVAFVLASRRGVCRLVGGRR